MRPVMMQMFFRCKGGQVLLFVVTNRHVNSSSWRDYKSLVKYIAISVKVQMCSAASDLGLHCLLRRRGLSVQICRVSKEIRSNHTPSEIILDPPLIHKNCCVRLVKFIIKACAINSL